jgi:antitoxin HicB
MATDLESYLHLDYQPEIVEEKTSDGATVYVASYPELKGCMAHGATREEAIENLIEAKALYIRGVLRRGGEVPLPRQPADPPHEERPAQRKRHLVHRRASP